MPSAAAVGGVNDKIPSPYNIPVVGQEDDHYSGRGGSKPKLHFGDMVDDFDIGKPMGGFDDMDDHSPIMDDHHHFDVNDDDDDDVSGFNYGSSPFKYHHDVSSKGDLKDNFDDQVRRSTRIVRIFLINRDLIAFLR